MPYISHGHWVGPGEPTQPEPPRARCGGPGLCPVCAREAAIWHSTSTGPQRHRYATADELVGLLARHIRRAAPRITEPIRATETVLDALRQHGVDVEALVEITAAEPDAVPHSRTLAERLAANQPRIELH